MLALGIALAQGQTSNPPLTPTTVTPSGSCNATSTALLTPNGTIYTCQMGTWGSVGGGGASGVSSFNTRTGAVTLTSGDVTTACPTCGLTTNPLSQFSATTSAQFAGVISDGVGTGLVMFGTPAYAAQADGATVTWAIAGALIAKASLLFTVHSGSRTLNLTGLVNGGSYVLKITQDGTGGEGLTLGTGCTWKVSGGGAGAVTPSATANAIDVLAFEYDGTNCLANFNKLFN